MNGQTFLKTLRLNSLKETLSLGQHFAAILTQKDVIALQGDLGAGKSTFARALIRILCPTVTDIPSPTFTLIQSYTPKNLALGPITHADFWRLKHPEEVLEIGIEEILCEGITLIEWPERMGTFLPPRALCISFTLPPNAPPEARCISIKGPPFWEKRLMPLWTFFPKEITL